MLRVFIKLPGSFISHEPNGINGNVNLEGKWFLKGEILLENLIIGGVILIDNYPKDVWAFKLG